MEEEKAVEEEEVEGAVSECGEINPEEEIESFGEVSICEGDDSLGFRVDEDDDSSVGFNGNDN